MATSLAPRSAPHPVHHRGALAGRRTPGNEGDADEGPPGAGQDPTRRLDELMPSRRRPDAAPTLSIFPEQLHIGDRFTDAETGDEPHEWEVVSRPVTFKKGHAVRARVQRPGDPRHRRGEVLGRAPEDHGAEERREQTHARSRRPPTGPRSCRPSSAGCAARSVASRRTRASSRSASPSCAAAGGRPRGGDQTSSGISPPSFDAVGDLST